MISANGVEYKNVPEQVQYLTEQVADIWTAIEGINPPDLTLYALKTYVDAADTALGTRITNVESSIGTLLTKTEAANTYAKIADIGTYINLSDYVKTVDMYTYVQSEIQNFDLDSNTDFTALKSRVSTLESSVSSMTSDIADANATAANAQTVAGNAVNTANNASAVATNAYNTATSAASDVADMQTTINNYDSRIDAVESTVDGFQASLNTAASAANAALAKADSALSMIAGLHSLTKEEKEFEGDSVTVAGFVEGSLCTLTKLEGDTKACSNLSHVAALSVGVVTPIGTTLKSGETYSFTFKGTLASGHDNMTIALVDDNSHQTVVWMNASGNRVTKTLTLEKDYSNIIIWGASGDKVENLMIVKGNTALDYVPYFDGLKSVSISGLSTRGGVVITTSDGTTSLIPTLDVDTLELRSWSYIEQSITDTSLVTTYVEGSTFVDLSTLSYGYNSNAKAWNSNDLTNVIKKPSTNGDAVNAVSDKYTIISVFDGYGQETSGVIYVNVSGSLYVNNGSSTTRPTGYLVYKRATPVTTVLATVTYTDVSAFFETGATITVNNANTGYLIESTSTMYGYVAE